MILKEREKVRIFLCSSGEPSKSYFSRFVHISENKTKDAAACCFDIVSSILNALRGPFKYSNSNGVSE